MESTLGIVGQPSGEKEIDHPVFSWSYALCFA
jgi:hypothetical protein